MPSQNVEVHIIYRIPSFDAAVPIIYTIFGIKKSIDSSFIIDPIEKRDDCYNSVSMAWFWSMHTDFPLRQLLSHLLIPSLKS